MVDHLAIAKEFIQEKLKERDDIVAVYIGGSVARGEETEASDVDLSLIVQGPAEPESQTLNVNEAKRMGTWREGIYLHWSLKREETLADLQEINYAQSIRIYQYKWGYDRA